AADKSARLDVAAAIWAWVARPRCFARNSPTDCTQGWCRIRHNRALRCPQRPLRQEVSQSVPADHAQNAHRSSGNRRYLLSICTSEGAVHQDWFVGEDDVEGLVDLGADVGGEGEDFFGSGGASVGEREGVFGGDGGSADR